MRDLETISLALETANTGHLVFATLHTNTAVSTVDRIVDQFPAEEQAQIRSVLADVLRGVITQTLVKKKDGGRLAALEILVVNPAVANHIREAKTVQIPSTMQTNRALGMQLLNDELAEMIEGRKIELADALHHAVDKKDLEKRFRAGLSIAADTSGERFRVVDVKANSPAYFAGLRRGHLISEIDTKPANYYSLEEARRALRADGTHPSRSSKAAERNTSSTSSFRAIERVAYRLSAIGYRLSVSLIGRSTLSPLSVVGCRLDYTSHACD